MIMMNRNNNNAYTGAPSSPTAECNGTLFTLVPGRSMLNVKCVHTVFFAGFLIF